jgi:hypothetical protein
VNRRDFLLTLPALSACRGKPGEGYHGSAWIASEVEPVLAVVDLLAFAVRRRVELKGRPKRLVRRGAEDARFLYACDFQAGLIEEVDVAAARRSRFMQISGPITGVRPDPRSHRLWVAACSPPRIVPIDLETLRQGRAVLLPSDPVSLDVSPAAPLAAATLRSGEAVFVDLEAGGLLSRIELGPDLGQLRFRSDGRAAIAANKGRIAVSILEPRNGRVVVELPLPLRPDRMWMKRDGGQIFITGEGRDAITIVYPYRTEVAQTFLSGRKPGEMADSVAPAYLFVSNPEANSLTVFDLETQKVVAVTQVGMGPGPIAVTPDQSYALVLNRLSGDVAVIRAAAITPGREKRAPLFTMIPVCAQPSHLLVSSA